MGSSEPTDLLTVKLVRAKSRHGCVYTPDTIGIGLLPIAFRIFSLPLPYQGRDMGICTDVPTEELCVMISHFSCLILLVIDGLPSSRRLRPGDLTKADQHEGLGPS